MDDTVTPQQLLTLKDRVVGHFTKGNWLELGILTGCGEMVENHGRLLRSLSFGDDDYEGNALSVLQFIIRQDPKNYAEVLRYVDLRYPDESGMNISSAPAAGPKIVFQPSVFSVPAELPDPNLLSAMMPFGPSFQGVHQAMVSASHINGMTCQRADDIWVNSTVIQDVFSLLFRSFIVVCDFTGKNPNVFYEAGIAHALGKHVIPITQHADDIPFDLRHHRYLHYLNNGEGLLRLQKELSARIAQLLLQRQ
jgi:hypothetical protein